VKFLHEMRHRQVFQLTGIYVAGAWGLLEVADIVFAALGIPELALRYVLIAEIVLFPVVFVTGWRFDIRRDGLFRTAKNPAGEFTAVPLGQRDYVVLTGLAAVAIAVTLFTVVEVWNSAGEFPSPIAEDVERAANSVAILPFDNLDTNPDTGYFSDGVTEEILHRLSSIRAIHVLGRNSSFAFRDSNLALSEISKLLAVEYLLEGSVRRDGNFVRVTARLTDQSGVQVWSETFDRKLEAIFAIQSEIAGAVSKRIAHEIVSSGGASTGRTTVSMEAFDEYLLGRKHAHDRIPGWHAKAREAFRRALELDPDYAPAHAGLAYALVINAPDVTEESLEDAIDTARRSIDLDPDLAEGHAILGLMVASNFSDRFGEGIAHLRRALELDPTFSDTYNWLSLLLAGNGQYEEAELMMERGHAVDPLLPSITANLAGRLSNAGDLERALRILERHTRLPELTNPIRGGLTQAYFEWGRYVEALRWIEDPESALVFEALGLRDEADNRLEGYETTDASGLFDLVLNGRHSRGEHHRALEMALTSLSQQERDLRQLGSQFGVPLLVIQVSAGAYGESIQLFETMSDADPAALSQATWSREGQDAINALAFAYQQTGNAAKAAELLAYRDERITRLEPLSSPHFLEPMALNAALRGDEDKAYELLSRAVDLGWANYYMTINDPRWGDTLSQPRFVALLERVQENLAQQRAEVEVMLASQSDS
jgi:TolB-like protein/Flp pilus assembly protein TadD